MSTYDETPRGFDWMAYLELVRLPNLFTAAADVAMGFLFVQAVWLHQMWIDVDTPILRQTEQLVLGLLVASSVLLYAAGVVLNDVFDLELDRRERPERPLPSGRIPLGAARAAGWGMLGAGAFLPWLVSGLAPRLWLPTANVAAIHQFRPGIVAIVLAVLIVLYDGVLKRTVAGPAAMGACRMLNVLLGMSVLPGDWWPVHWLVAGAIGVYIAGVTWFARNESGESQRWQLAAALGVMLAGVGLLALLPLWIGEDLRLQVDPFIWYVVMGLVAARIIVRCGVPLADPHPSKVRGAVAQAILSLVVLDAAACFAVRGLAPALWIILLIIPTVILAQWIKPT